MRSMPIFHSYQWLMSYSSARQAVRGVSRALRGYDGGLEKNFCSLSPLSGCPDRIGNHAERKDELERVVQQRQSAEALVPTRRFVVLRVDGERDTADL